MLSSYDLAILDGICETARALRSHDWIALTIYNDGGLATSLAEEYGYVKVTLRGARKRQFDDWLAACTARCAPLDRPTSNRQVSHLDDQIIFQPSATKI